MSLPHEHLLDASLQCEEARASKVHVMGRSGLKLHWSEVTRRLETAVSPGKQIELYR